MNRFLLISTLFFTIYHHSNGQNTSKNHANKCISKFDTVSHRSYYRSADVMPVYKGGSKALKKTIAKHLIWPGGRCCMVGRVYVSFIIEADGSVANKKIAGTFMQDNAICYPNKEALRVIDCLTEWKPGQCDGKNVPVLYVLPITFDLYPDL